MRAMILAAGEGSRLRPLTATTHKALLPIGNTTLLEHNILKLARAGITDIVINVWYLAEQVMAYAGDGSRYGVKIHYSHETQGRLGTAGGIHNALPLLGEHAFWVLSADIYSDYVLPTQMLLAQDQACHLVMVPNPSYHLQGDFGLQNNGRLSLQAPTHTFGSIAVLRPQVFASFTPGSYDLGPVFRQLITAQKAHGELYQGPWFNVGTEQELQAVRAHCHATAG